MGLLAPGKSVSQSPVRPSELYVQKIQLAQEKNQRALSLHFSRPPDSVHAFTLRSPIRLVIDVRGEVERSASATHSASDTLITRVRVGSHPHHTRFVLDLKANQLPPFSVEQQAHVVTAILNEQNKRDALNDDQASGPQQGDTQILFARAPETSSQPVLSGPTQAPMSPAPTVLAKKVTKKPSQPPLRRATPPVPTPHVTPDKEAPPRATPLSAAAKERREAIPLKVPPASAPLPPAPAPASASSDTPQPLPVSPAPTVLAKKVTKKLPSPPPLRRATPPASTSRVTPDKGVPPRTTPLPSTPQGRRAAIPLKDPPPAVSRLPAPTPSTPSPDTSQPPPEPATAARHLRQGYTLYNQGDVDGAIRQWRKAIDQAPGYAEAHYRIGVALQERGELPQAITALREATRLNPDDATIHIHLARACEAAGNTQDALAAYRAALQLVPTSAHVHHRIGHVLAAQGDLAGAMQAWRQTIHLQPDYAYAYVSLGRALGQTGQKDEAVAAYEQALQLDPRAPFVAEVRQQIAQLRAAEP